MSIDKSSLNLYQYLPAISLVLFSILYSVKLFPIPEIPILNNLTLIIALLYTLPCAITTLTGKDCRLSWLFTDKMELPKIRKQMLSCASVLLFLALSSPVCWLIHGRQGFHENMMHFVFNGVGFLLAIASLCVLSALPKFCDKHLGKLTLIEWSIFVAVSCLQVRFQYLQEPEPLKQGLLAPFLNIIWLCIVTTLTFIALTYMFSAFIRKRKISMMIKNREVNLYLAFLFVVLLFVIIYLIFSTVSDLPLTFIYNLALLFLFVLLSFGIFQHAEYTKNNKFGTYLSMLLVILIVFSYFWTGKKAFPINTTDEWFAYQIGIGFLVMWLIVPMALNIRIYFSNKKST